MAPHDVAAPAMKLTALLRRDLARYCDANRGGRVSRPAWLVIVESCLFKSGFQTVVLYRLSHRLFQAGWLWAAWALARVNQLVTGADIEFSAQIGPGLLIAHPAAIVIGRGTVIGEDATIFQ